MKKEDVHKHIQEQVSKSQGPPHKKITEKLCGLYDLFVKGGLKTDPNFDKDFCSDEASKFHHRFWEIYLGVQLLELAKEKKDFTVSSPKEGPDFKLSFKDDKPIWIEAISVKFKEEEEGVDETICLTDGTKITTIDIDQKNINKILIRHSNAFKTKRDKCLKYIEKNIIREQDRIVIAINSSQLSEFEPMRQQGQSSLPALLDILYGTCQNVYLRLTHEWSINIQKTINKRKDDGSHISIATDLFLSKKCTEISGAIGSSFNPFQIKEDKEILYFIRNIHPDNIIEPSLFSNMNNYSIEEDKDAHCYIKCTGTQGKQIGQLLRMIE